MSDINITQRRKFVELLLPEQEAMRPVNGFVLDIERLLGYVLRVWPTTSALVFEGNPALFASWRLEYDHDFLASDKQHYSMELSIDPRHINEVGYKQHIFNQIIHAQADYIWNAKQ